MAINTDKDSLIQLAIGPLVALVIFTLSFTKVLERAELLSYDWRLNVRNNLFGKPAMDPRLGTIDIDDKSIEAEGRYQDWTRDKYTDVVQRQFAGNTLFQKALKEAFEVLTEVTELPSDRHLAYAIKTSLGSAPMRKFWDRDTVEKTNPQVHGFIFKQKFAD